MYAVRHNHANVVKVLIKVDKNLHEALDLAIREGCLGVVKELIEGGADVNYVNDDEDTPLIIAIEHARATAEFSLQQERKTHSRWSQRREIIQTLLGAGADVNHVNKHGRTALMEAVKQHDVSTVLSLLKIPEIHSGSFFGFGIKPINYSDKDGNTALIIAVKSICYTYINDQEYNICKNSQIILKFLLDTPSIDQHHANHDGDTAITLLEELEKKMNSYPH